MVTCRTFVEFLMDYILGDLPDPQRNEFDAHLSACTACVTYMNTYLETIKLGKAAFGASDALLPEEVPADLVKAILEARSTEK